MNAPEPTRDGNWEHAERRDDLSAKAARALPRIRRHIEAAKREQEWRDLFTRKGPPCGLFRHHWLRFQQGFSWGKVCTTCGIARRNP